MLLSVAISLSPGSIIIETDTEKCLPFGQMGPDSNWKTIYPGAHSNSERPSPTAFQRDRPARGQRRTKLW